MSEQIFYLGGMDLEKICAGYTTCSVLNLVRLKKSFELSDLDIEYSRPDLDILPVDRHAEIQA